MAFSWALPWQHRDCGSRSRNVLSYGRNVSNMHWPELPLHPNRPSAPRPASLSRLCVSSSGFLPPFFWLIQASPAAPLSCSAAGQLLRICGSERAAEAPLRLYGLRTLRKKGSRAELPSSCVSCHCSPSNSPATGKNVHHRNRGKEDKTAWQRELCKKGRPSHS